MSEDRIAPPHNSEDKIPLVELRDTFWPDQQPSTVSEIATAISLPHKLEPHLQLFWAAIRQGRFEQAGTMITPFASLCWEEAGIYPEVSGAALGAVAEIAIAQLAEHKLDLPNIAEPPDPGHVDLSTVLDDLDPAQPKYGIRDDGKALLYPGRTHLFVGQPESGKTWLALHIAAERIAAAKARGGTSPVAVFVDLEDTPAHLVRRLAALGVDPQDTARFVAYYSPERLDGNTVAAMAPALGTAEVVILDSANEALAASGLDPNSNQDVSTFRQQALNPLSLIAHRAAIVVIDHEGHARNSRALGGVMKMAAVTGAAFVVRAVEQPTPEHGGRLALYVVKDREGQVRGAALAPEQGTNRQHVANLALEANSKAPTWYKDRKTAIGSTQTTLWSPVGATTTHRVDLEAADAAVVAMRELAAEGRTPVSKRRLHERIRANGTKRNETDLGVLDEWLAKEGWFVASKGKSGHDVFDLGPQAAKSTPSAAPGGAPVPLPKRSEEVQATEVLPKRSEEVPPSPPKNGRHDGPETSSEEVPKKGHPAPSGTTSSSSPPLGDDEVPSAPPGRDFPHDPETGRILFGDEGEDT